VRIPLTRDILIRGGYVATTVVILALYPALPEAARLTVTLAAASASFLATAVGIRRTERHHHRIWILLVAALASITISTILSLIPQDALSVASELLDMAGYLLLLTAAMTLVLQRGRNNLGSVIDTVIAALAAGGVLWSILLRPHLPSSEREGLERLTLLIIILAILATVGALTQLVLIQPATAVGVLIAGGVLALAGNIVLAVGRGAAASTAAGMLFIGGYTAVGLFGLDPAAPTLVKSAPAPPGPERLSVRRLTLLGLAMTVIPILVGVEMLLGHHRDGLVLLVTSTTITVLVVARIGHLSRQRDRAEKALRHQATHDPLTGLPNRREFHTMLDQLTQRQHPAILFCDLDRFKAINDQYGHASGDNVLNQVAQRLRNSVRTDDIVCRYGGDEFVILFPAITWPELNVISRTITRQLTSPFTVDGNKVTIGASLGAAIATAKSTPTDLIAHADHAMYQHKSSHTATDAVRPN
jgi:diguanylate cyclase (GGDEF)-like protein